jgi:hypothetical protein
MLNKYTLTYTYLKNKFIIIEHNNLKTQLNHSRTIDLINICMNI